MFLGAFHFDGRLDEVLPAYERMLAGYPPEQSRTAHLCRARRWHHGLRRVSVAGRFRRSSPPVTSSALP